MKYLNLVFASIFLLFALVQFNDPDPLLWVALYGYTAAMFVMAYLGKLNKWALAVGVLVYFPLAAFYFPGNVSEWLAAEEQAKSIEMKMPFVEEARESLGLFLCFLSVSGLLIKNALFPKSIVKEKKQMAKA